MKASESRGWWNPDAGNVSPNITPEQQSVKYGTVKEKDSEME